ncbi:MAG: glycosyltransferase family 2 protein [Planctomycetota bacterium]
MIWLITLMIVLALPLYLVLVQAFIGWWAHRRRQPPDAALARDHRLLLLMPAHNESTGIAATIRCIREVLAADACNARVVVIADNCDDDTARQASEAGAEVRERHDPTHRGKGYALAWGMQQLADDASWQSVVVVDADIRPQPGCFAMLAAELAAGAPVVQSFSRLFLEPAPRSQLLTLAYALINCARPMGRHALGGLALAAAGYRVKPVPEAMILCFVETVSSAAPQRRRWEAGRFQAIRRCLPRLLRQPRWSAWEAALDLLVLPLALPVMALVPVTLLAGLLGWWPAFWLGILFMTLPVAALIPTCRITGLPMTTLQSLWWAPVYMLWKSGLYLHPGFWRPRAWVRTPRSK